MTSSESKWYFPTLSYWVQFLLAPIPNNTLSCKAFLESLCVQGVWVDSIEMKGKFRVWNDDLELMVWVLTCRVCPPDCKLKENFVFASEIYFSNSFNHCISSIIRNPSVKGCYIFSCATKKENKITKIWYDAFLSLKTSILKVQKLYKTPLNRDFYHFNMILQRKMLDRDTWTLRNLHQSINKLKEVNSECEEILDIS